MCPSLTVQIGNSYLWGWFHPEVTWLHGSSAFEVYWGGGLSGCWCCCWVSRWSREAARLSSFMGETDALAEGSRGNSWRGPNHDLARLAGVDIKSSSYQWNFHKFKNLLTFFSKHLLSYQHDFFGLSFYFSVLFSEIYKFVLLVLFFGFVPFLSFDFFPFYVVQFDICWDLQYSIFNGIFEVNF